MSEDSIETLQGEVTGPAADVSEDYLPVEGEEELGEEAGDGLEMDEGQSEEIRRIFGTTLPQYLQPVEEMVEQVLSGSADAETVKALLGTIASLCSAAERMGFAGVVEGLGRMGRQLEGLDPSRVPRAAREAIISELLELKDLAADFGGDTQAPEGSGSETIFRALGRVEGIGNDVLQRLSAAGLVLVDQLRQARPAEIAAVTGLAPEQVERILAGLIDKDEAATDEPPGDTLRRRLEARVEAEAEVQEVRHRVRELGARIRDARAGLQQGEDRRRAAAEELERVGAQLARLERRLARARGAREELACRHAELGESLRQQEGRTVALLQARRELRARDAELQRALRQIADGVETTLRRAAGPGQEGRSKR